jgi:cytochrome c oxidase subunit 3
MTDIHAPGHATGPGPAYAAGHGDAHGHGAPKHPYHLVDPSPWPIVGAIAAGLLATCGVLYMHGHGTALMIIGFIAVLATMAVWWRDVIREALAGFHTPVVQLGLRYGMALFIASEVMFFSAFFWAFFAAALYPVDGVWPPKGIHPFDPWEFPFLNTLILLLSGTTVTWAHHSLLEGNNKGLVQGLIVTVLLGMCFTGVQAYEYAHAAFGFKDGIYPSTFFMATGFHGFHVMVGTIFLAVCLWRATQGHFKPDHHFGLEAAAWYWHFVDVVWLFLFVCIYWWGMGNALPAGH